MIWLECLVICLTVFGLFFKWVSSVQRPRPKMILSMLLGLLALAAVASARHVGLHGLYYGMIPHEIIPYSLSILCFVVIGSFLLRKRLGKRSYLFLTTGLALAVCCLWVTAYVLGNKAALCFENKVARITKQAYANLPAPVPDSENSFLIYKNAADEIGKSDWKRLYNIYENQGDIDPQEVESFLSARQHLLNEIRRASSLPGYDPRFVVKDQQLDIKFSHYRGIVYLCSIAARNHARYGRFHESMLCLRDIKVLAEKMYKSPGTILYAMIGSVLHFIAERSMERCLYDACMASGIKGPFQPPVWETSINEHDLDTILDMELAFTAHAVAAYCDDKECGGKDNLPWETRILFFFKSFQRVNAHLLTNAVEDRYDNYKKIGQLPCGQFEEALEAYEASCPDDYLSLTGATSFAAHAPIVQYKVMNYNNVEKTALAVFAYRMEHGQYPQKADDLVPEYLDAIPEDSCSGGPLQLEIVEGGVTIRSLEQGGYDENTIGRGLNTAVEFHMGAAYEKYRLSPPEEGVES